MSFWMEKKLDYSQEILAALTSAESDDLQLAANRMRALSRIEGFVRRRNPTYTEHLQLFDLATRQLVRRAKKSDLEGSTLAFHQLTSSCVTCHVALREELTSAE